MILLLISLYLLTGSLFMLISAAYLHKIDVSLFTLAKNAGCPIPTAIIAGVLSWPFIVWKVLKNK